jgi:branched-chain amino acid transport system substrate-binding protein
VRGKIRYRYSPICVVLVSMLVFSACGGGSSSSSSGPTGATGAPSTTSAKVIDIGALLDLSGPLAAFGIPTNDGVKLAVEQANSSGGVLGKQLTLTEQDAGSNPAIAVTGLRKLIGDGVSAVLGPVSTSALLVTAPVAKSTKVLLLAPNPNGDLPSSVQNPYTFLFAPVNSAVLPIFLTRAEAMIHFKRLAIVYDPTNATSVDEQESLKSLASKTGYSVVAEETAPSGTGDFSSILSLVQAAKPDAIWASINTASDFAAFAKQLRARGSTEPMLAGPPVAESASALNLAGASAKGLLTYVPFVPNSKVGAVTRFVSAYQARYHSTPDANAAEGYDAANALIAALRKAKSSSRAAVVSAYSHLDGITGVMGPIKYAGGPYNVGASVAMVKWEGSQFVQVSGARITGG